MTNAAAATTTKGMAISPSSTFQGVQYTHLELRVDKVEHFEYEQDAVKIFQDTGMHRASQESFWVLAFGALLNIGTVFEVNKGMMAYVELHLPSLIGGVLASGCERFWLAHNHPSMSLAPSPDDRIVTKEVMDAANAVKLHFEDHLILTPDGKYMSFAHEGLLIPDPESVYLKNRSPRARND